MQHLHRHLRSQSGLFSILSQHRGKFSGTFFHQDQREQTRRAKRQKRRAQKNVLRNWQSFCGNAEWSREDEVHTFAHSQQALERAEKKLWKWLVGQTRTVEATRMQKKGWLKWLKQGGAAQLGRERSRQPESDPHVFREHYWGPMSGASSGGTAFSYTWTESWNMSGGEGWGQGGSDAHWTYDYEAWSHRSGSSSGASESTHSRRQPSRQTAADSARSKSLRLLGLSHSVTLTSAVLQEAFRKCALTWHPDRHSGAAKHAAEEKFKEVQAAYQLLKANIIA
ncbi:probable chaperone protein DnaJ at C-terminar half [Coccomyxa sp. Obi]|nr:probable chaperone protein DnaJ at C-terminar half [Coccomyxa sp. Obi]